MSEPIDFDIAVVERDRPDYGDVELCIRQFGMEAGRGFSRWLASPSSGRFLILRFPAEAIEEMIWNCSTEEELFEAVGQRYLAFMNLNRRSGGAGTFDLNTFVTPAVHEKLQQMHGEIMAIVTKDSPPTGER